MSWYLVTIVAVSIAIFLYRKVKKRANYWKDRNVPYRSALPQFKETMDILTRKVNAIESVKIFYNKYDGERYVACFVGLTPTLQIRDPELIRRITIKDFDHFVDHTGFAITEIDPLFAKNLIALTGTKWRHMRATLSPSFTSSKMRLMFTLMQDCAEKFIEHFTDDENVKSGKDIDVRDAFRRYTNDVIATSAFGITVNSLADKNNEFFAMGNEVATASIGAVIRQFLYFLFPKLMQLLRVPLFPKRITEFFQRVINETIELRETKGIVRPDMIHLLLEMRKGKQMNDDGNVNNSKEGFAAVDEEIQAKIENNRGESLTNEDITAQALLFFLAGFENAAIVLSFLCLELGLNAEAQRKLQDEIDETLKKCGGKITYEALLGMKYLDMVTSETLRKWPPAFLMDRLCVKDYVIEPESPKEAKLTVEKGVSVSMMTIGIHYDPKYYPEPYQFDPERFSDENKDNLVPFTYLPFGSGPRNCIGSRFALLEIKILCFHLFSKFDVVSSEKTQVPLVSSPKNFSLEPAGGFFVGLRPRT